MNKKLVKRIIIPLNLLFFTSVSIILINIHSKYILRWIEFSKGFAILKDKINPVLTQTSKYIKITIFVLLLFVLLQLVLMILEFAKEKKSIKNNKKIVKKK